MVNALLLKPLPYPDPDRLAVLWLRSPGINIPQDWPSPGQYIDIQQENHSFEEMSISQGRGGTLLGAISPSASRSLRTSSSLFHLLGAQPLHGRLLLPEEDVPGKAPVVDPQPRLLERDVRRRPERRRQEHHAERRRRGRGEAKNLFTVVGVLRPDVLDEQRGDADRRRASSSWTSSCRCRSAPMR